MKSGPSGNPWQKLCEHIGLSEYEAKVYVSLITEGPSKARRISMTCGVPRTKVYGTLRKLIERGLVVEIPEEPRRFAPASPVGAFKVYLQSFEKKARDLQSVVSSLENTYETTKATSKSKEGKIWIIHGRSEILRRTREMLSHTEEFVKVTTTENGLIVFYKACNKLLDRLAEREVRVQIGVPIGSRNQNVAEELRYVCDVQHVDVGSPILYVCVDGRAFLLANLIPDDFNKSSDRDVGVFSDNPVLYNLISPFLPHEAASPSQDDRRTAKPLAPKNREVGTGKR